jgi:Bacterial mobilisation protein (MobC)
MARLCHNQSKNQGKFCHLHGYVFLAIFQKAPPIQRPTVFARRKFGLDAPAPRILALPVGRPEKVTVRFRESEMRQLAEVSHQRGMTRTGWIVALVRSRLGSPVQHSPDEHAALRAVVRELNRIGGNINQIARAANTSVLQGRAVEPDLSAIQEAKLVVDTALAQLRNALDGNADYWDGRQ